MSNKPSKLTGHNKLDLVEQMELAEKIGELNLRGYTESQIARQLDMKRADVVFLLNGWRDMLRRESRTATQVKDLVMDILAEAKESWGLISQEAWHTVQQADDQGHLGHKISALKLLDSVNRNRNKAFADAGVGYDTELIEEMNETQRKQDILIDILKEVKDKWPEASQYIAKKLADATREVIVLEVEDDV